MPRFQCANCDFQTDDGSKFTPLSECNGLGERLEPGGVVPAGECPQCQAFVYLHEGSADELMHWLANVAEGAKVYIDDGGLTLRAVGTNDYYDLAGTPPDDEFDGFRYCVHCESMTETEHDAQNCAACGKQI